MYIDNDRFETWMERIMNCFDETHSLIKTLNNNTQTMIEGERLLDNHDLCQLLRVSKRTLQRYRSSGELPFQTIYHKTYYKESDVQKFIKTNFEKDKDNNEIELQ